jgi:hypothetical protein
LLPLLCSFALVSSRRSRAVFLSNASLALPAAARLLPAFRAQPTAHAIAQCAAATRPSDALKENNKKAVESLLAGSAAALQGVRVLLLSDSTDYNALAYAGGQQSSSNSHKLPHNAESPFCWPRLHLLNHVNHFHSSSNCILQTATFAACCHPARARASTCAI